MKRRVMFAIASVSLFATCCPTLWLAVTKNDPIPRFAAPLPVIAADPITPPPILTNRCDVFHGGQPCSFAPAYTDDVDASADPVSTRTRALEAFANELPAWIPKPGASIGSFADPATCVTGKVRCQSRGSGCVSIDTDAPFSGDIAVHILTTKRALDRVVMSHDPDHAGTGTFLTLTESIDGAEIANQTTVTVCASTLELSRPLLSFIHMSDIQLRDGSVTLEDRELSKRLDWMIQSFEYDPDLAFYNPYVVQAMFATINADVRRYAVGDPRRPDFIIHTGDSIDSGVMSELRMFHALVHTLTIPLFEVIGNHDALVFGNLVPTSRDDDKECATIRSVAPPSLLTRLVPEKLCASQTIVCPSGRCLPDELQLVADPSHKATVKNFIAGLTDQPYDHSPPSHDVGSTTHGFNLNHDIGYYYYYQPLAFEAAGDAKAMFVVLDGEDLETQTGGTDGHMGAVQTAWLENVVACEKAHPQDLMFVMAHQPIGSIKLEDPKKSLASILDASDNMVGYLYGHYHEHAICAPQPGRTPCSRFWEVETGSLIEFPQEARMIRIKQVSENIGFLEMYTFKEHLSDKGGELARLVELGRRGAERDQCRSHPGFPCSDDLRPYRNDGRETGVRLFFKFPKANAGASGPDPAQNCKDVEDTRKTEPRPAPPPR